LGLYTKYSLLLVSALLIGNSCANKISLSGGPKDEVPPQLDTLKSTPNYQLQFTPQEIILTFDEFINFKDPSKNVVISPPLQYGMEIDQRGKVIKISFDEKEVLKPDVTYIINFGESIADYTENNVLKNFSYVCSTGDYIDSLSIGGKVFNAFTKAPVENITVMLYENLEDSVVFTQQPFYFTKTEGDGSFKLKNLRGDTFKIVAIRDLNLNYMYDESAEEFAFLNENIIVADTNQQNLELLSFRAATSPRYQEGDVIHDGLFSLKFDQKLEFNPVTAINKVDSYIEKDNMLVRAYIKDIELYPIQFEIKVDTIQDTIAIRKPQNKDRKDLPTLKLMKSNIKGDIGLHPKDTLEIEFNFPLDSLNRVLMNMDESEIFISPKNPKKVWIVNEWDEGEDYSLSLDSNSIVDFYGRSIDSTGYDFEVARRNAFGTYEISLSYGDEDVTYILTIIDSDRNEIHVEYVNRESESFIMNNMIPGPHTMSIIMDMNQNKKWDTGNYSNNLQPERIKNIAMDIIESNRTTSFSVDLETVFSQIDSTKIDLIETKE
tara:strand:- start:1731 stop:3371 length:1641 start_codon:yes stop_codon:yes gene_type:complete